MKLPEKFEYYWPGTEVIGFFLAFVIPMFWIVWATDKIWELEQQEIVQVDMTGLMREFVDAQARSGADPDETKKAIARYLGATEASLAIISRNGKTILMSDAVLSNDTRDITPEVRSFISMLEKGSKAEDEQ